MNSFGEKIANLLPTKINSGSEKQTQNSTAFLPFPPGSSLSHIPLPCKLTWRMAGGLQPLRNGASLPSSSSHLSPALMWTLHGLQFLQEYPCASLWHPPWAAGDIFCSMEMFLLHFPLTLVFPFLNMFSQKCPRLAWGTQLCSAVCLLDLAVSHTGRRLASSHSNLSSANQLPQKPGTQSLVRY